MKQQNWNLTDNRPETGATKLVNSINSNHNQQSCQYKSVGTILLFLPKLAAKQGKIE